MEPTDVDQLRHQIQLLRQENQKLHQKIDHQARQNQRLSSLQRNQFQIKQRVGCLLSMMRFLREGIYTCHSTSHISPCVRSSFTRHLFHFLFHQETHLDAIEISFTTAPTIDTERIFDHLSHYLLLCLSVDQSTSGKSAPSFYYYDLTEIHRVTPQVLRLVLARSHDRIEVVLHLYHTEIGDGSTDLLLMSSIGITGMRTSYTFFQSLEDIFLKQTEICLPVQEYQMAAFPSCGKALTFQEKTKYLREMYQIIVSRVLDWNQKGYSLIGLVPDWRMEHKQECPITSCSPPYPMYRLKCQHELSAMAYKGILLHPMDSSESIRCPYCRCRLEIAFRQDSRRKVALKAIQLLPLGMGESKIYPIKDISEEAMQQI